PREYPRAARRLAAPRGVIAGRLQHGWLAGVPRSGPVVGFLWGSWAEEMLPPPWLPALPGVFAGEVGCSVITEPMSWESDKPPEKRKVGSSTLPLTTHHRAAETLSDLR